MSRFLTGEVRNPAHGKASRNKCLWDGIGDRYIRIIK